MPCLVLDEKELNRIKEIELSMLKECISVCDKLGIKYYLTEGTLLGAVRHKGFIPWDDDIDICMMRDEYELFRKEAPRYLSENLFLQDNKTDNEALINYVKIRNSDTTFVETSSKDLKINHGIYIDIFPLDFYPDGKLEELFFLIKKHCLRLCVEKGYYRRKLKRKLISIIVNGFLNMILSGIKPKNAVILRDKLFTSIKKSNRVANYSTPWGNKEIVPKDWFGEGVFLEFEGIKARCPKEFDKWLTQVYGDYMQPPPVEERKSHHYVEVVDFDKSYKEYVS